MDQSFRCHVRVGRTLQGDSSGRGGVIVQGPNTMNPKAENAVRPAAPCKFQQWLDARVMDDDPLLQHEGGVKDDGLHTKVRHHIYSRTETQA